MQRLAAAQARLKDLEMVTQKRQERATNPVTRGRGMIRRADKYLAQRSRNGFRVLYQFYPPSRIDLPPRMTTTQHGSPQSRNTTLRKRIPKRIGMMWRGTMTMCLWAPTQHPNPAVTANRTQRRNQRKRKESRGRRPTNARKEDERRKGRVVLSLFRDSPKEGALTYTDWRREVEEYIWKGYDDSRIKDAMLSSVEGQAYVNFCSCDEGRNCTLAQILKERDSIYNVSVTFRDLNARMCGLKQGMNEPIKT